MKLEQLINQQLILKIDKKKGKLLLSEEKNKSDNKTLYQVELREIPPDTLAFSLDSLIELQVKMKGDTKEIATIKAGNYFLGVPEPTDENDGQEHKRINKVCDAILLVFNEKRVTAYLFEMKSGRIEPGKYEHQLISSKLFVEYLIRMYNTFYGEKYGEYSLEKFNFVLLYRGTILDVPYEHQNIRGNPEIPFVDMDLYQEKIFKFGLSKHLGNYIEFPDIA